MRKHTCHPADLLLPKVGNFEILKLAAICGKFNLTSHHKIFIN